MREKTMYLYRNKTQANGCSFNLLGETQEEDRQHIADLVTAKMIACLIEPAESLHNTNIPMNTRYLLLFLFFEK
jgi:hypothetical protein